MSTETIKSFCMHYLIKVDINKLFDRVNQMVYWLKKDTSFMPLLTINLD